MDITKTLSAIQGEFILAADITIDMQNGIFTRGFTVKQLNETRNSFSGQVTIPEIFTEMTVEEQDAVRKFFKIGTRMTANNGVEPDTSLIDTDIEDELI